MASWGTPAWLLTLRPPRLLCLPPQIGTGVMVGLPGQTLRDLAGDIMFFRDLGADMIGMVRRLACLGRPKWGGLLRLGSWGMCQGVD